MPASDISRITHSFPPGMAEWARQACATMANQAAKNQVAEQIRTGVLSRNNPEIINATFKQIYYAEYYRQMNIFESSGQQQPRHIYIEPDNRSAKKFFGRHTVVQFSKLNYFIHVHRYSITVGRYNFPLDGDESPETKDAFVTAWPGPLDKLGNRQGQRKVTDYIETLQTHDSVRRIKYCDSENDGRRRLILSLLKKLIEKNGSIDAAGITGLLLCSQETDINKEDMDRKPIETIQKYLLKGKRADAIKYTRSKRFFEHAQCLAFLDKYQPPNTANYTKDSIKLEEDSIVQLNDDYIKSLPNNYSVLKTVYRSLLNRMLETDPESIKIIKRPNVANNHYEFAILSANDCEMDFDQSNEVFKLIRASKRIHIDPVETFRHLIALGYTYLERSAYEMESLDDVSNRSHLSFKSGDNFASRTLIISNFDMLIINEIWEYCLNLARDDPSHYEYITNLIPYKLVFASCLFDFGLYNMFAQYIDSIRNSLAQAKSQQYMYGDTFYDWSTIEQSFTHLWATWELFQANRPGTLPHHGVTSLDSIPFQSNIYDSGYNVTQPTEPVHSSPPVEQNDVPYYNNYQNEWDIQPIAKPEPPQPQPQPQLQPPPQPQPQPQVQLQPQPKLQPQQEPQPEHQQEPQPEFQQEPQPEFQQEPQPEFQPQPPPQLYKGMKSSSPVNKTRDSFGDSFPFSPIQETSDNQNNFLANLVGTAKSLLPKSNSKPMILPDDTTKTIDYDSTLGKWVNRSDPNGALEDEVTDAPPLMAANNSGGPSQYSFKKSSRGRYPTPPNFQ